MILSHMLRMWFTRFQMERMSAILNIVNVWPTRHNRQISFIGVSVVTIKICVGAVVFKYC